MRSVKLTSSPNCSRSLLSSDSPLIDFSLHTAGLSKLRNTTKETVRKPYGVVNVITDGDTSGLSVTAERLYQALLRDNRANVVFRQKEPLVPCGYGFQGCLLYRPTRERASVIWSSIERTLNLSEAERIEALIELHEHHLAIVTTEPMWMENGRYRNEKNA
jgi:hypothetical protein